MTRASVDKLLAELSDLNRESRILVQRVVDARSTGKRDDAAIERLEMLSQRRRELTRLDHSAAA